MRVISLAKGVYATPTGEDPCSFRIVAEAGLNVRSITQGLGILYFNWEPGGKYPRPTHSLFMPSPQPAGATVPIGGLSGFDVSISNKFPCTGALSPVGFGFVSAPTVKLDIAEGKDTAVMFISPRKEDFEIAPAKTSLSIPSDGSEASVVLRSDGELRCEGTVSSGFTSAMLLLTRNSSPPMVNPGIGDKIAEVREAGAISGTWKPVMRSFEDALLVFHPASIGVGDLDELVNHVTGKDLFDIEEGSPPVVIGEGIGAVYHLKLVLKRHLRRDVSDETTLTLT